MESLDYDIEMGNIVVTCGNIHKGFEYPLLRFVVIAENDIFTIIEKRIWGESSND